MNITCRKSALAGMSLLLLVACERENRQFHEPPPSTARSNGVQLSDLQAGPTLPRIEGLQLGDEHRVGCRPLPVQGAKFACSDT